MNLRIYKVHHIVFKYFAFLNEEKTSDTTACNKEHYDF